MGLRDSCRPKHQVLILKCYPKFQKSTAEVKPNSSELSYLLYYASTRRSKLQKLGAYLEKRSESDVRRSKLGNVQVTLQILTALIEKCFRDLALFAPYILNILSTVVESGDINFVEESVPTFSALCLHLDQAAFAAEPTELRQYEELVSTYASFASKSFPSRWKSKATSLPAVLRFRAAGLEALLSLVSSDSFGAFSNNLKVVMSPILEQLMSDDPRYFRRLQKRENSTEQQEREQALKRRQSMGIRKSTDIQRGADPAAASGTTADIDKQANEEVGVLAMKSLRKIFHTNNRGQVRVAISTILDFVLNNPGRASTADEKQARLGQVSSTSASELLEAICRWTAVQDRFIVLVTTMEALISSPIVESDLPRQLLLSETITRLLRSNINFIGLSVMDVMIGLIQHVLLLLQLGGNGSSLAPHPQQSLAANTLAELSSGAEKLAQPAMEVVSMPSGLRIDLLDQLQQCVSDLAMHVYYTDQIGDLISALTLRLKPAVSSICSPTSAVENPEDTVNAIADSINLQEKPNTDAFFSFTTARVIALQCVKGILVTANSRQRDNGSADVRTRVGVSVWEGTQWLLRDPDATVRRAYVDALLTWLYLEVDKAGLRLAEESVKDNKTARRSQTLGDGVPNRGLSNASMRAKAKAKAHTSFMQLLHLAVYEHAMAHSDSEPDILLLHLLLTTLVQKLGVNSVRSGLPMMFQLQEEASRLPNPGGVILVSSLVHSYFLVLSQTFNFEGSVLGREIRSEMSRRASQNLWAKSITIPPTPLTPMDAMNSKFATGSSGGNPPAESLKLMTSRNELVNCISEGYLESILSPPTSPPSSPGRPMNRMRSLRNSISSQQPLMLDRGLPSKVKNEMLEQWSREACIQAADLERSRTISVTGSKSGSGSSPQNHSPDGRAGNGAAAAQPTLRASAYGSLGHGRRTGASYPGKRYISPASLGTPTSISSAKSVVRVDDLKRALSGKFTPQSLGQQDGMTEDTTSDSMMSGDFTASDTSLPVEPNGQNIVQENLQSPPSALREAEPLHHSTPPPDDDIPPVPMLPANLRPIPQGVEGHITAESIQDLRGNNEQPRSDSARVLPGRANLQALLHKTDWTSSAAAVSSTGAPPY